MKIAYFDCFSGISGDMVLGALLDAGLSIETISKELKKLNLKGYEIKKARARRGELEGTKFDVVVKASKNGHTHRSLNEILKLIDESSLSGIVKKNARKIFEAIGDVEAGVHGVADRSKLHLHELGDMDSIIDIVGAAIALDALGIDEVYSSPVTFGRTLVNTKAGVLPTPAPASLALLKGAPIKVTDIAAELVTPTGAGILKALSKGFGPAPQMDLSGIGYGAGTKELSELPNMLRVIIGERREAFKEDRVFVVETNIDDMNPQGFEYVSEKLFGLGALDVYTESIQMKKSRPAFKLTVLAEPGDLEKICSIIFSETTTIGIRYYETNRFKLDRKTVKVDTKYGSVPVKLSKGPGGIMTVSPEYDECVKIAKLKNVPLKRVCEEARRAVEV